MFTVLSYLLNSAHLHFTSRLKALLHTSILHLEDATHLLRIDKVNLFVYLLFVWKQSGAALALVHG